MALLLPGCHSGRRFPRLERPPALLWIVVDALRPDHLSLYGYKRETSPELAKLAADAVLFRNARAAAPKTIPSVPQMLSSSLYPDLERATTWMELLDAGPWHSAAVVNNPWVQKWIARLEPTFDSVAAGSWPAEEITGRALAWIDRARDAPVAMYLHYLDTHTPYDVPLPYRSMFVDAFYRGPVGLGFGDVAGARAGAYDAGDQERIGDLYDGTIAYTDAQLGRLFDALKQRRLYDDAMIVVTADHGEEFWEHGSFFHGQSLYDELLRVPLLIKFPSSWNAGVEVTAAVSTLDLLPTVAEVMGAAAGIRADASWQGRSLVPLAGGLRGDARVLSATVGRAESGSAPRHAVFDARSKLIVNVFDGSRELYDLARDPRERRNLLTGGAEPAAEPPAGLVEAYRRATEPLAKKGVHLRLSGDGRGARSYEVEVSTDPPAPLVNLHRVALDDDDRLTLSDHSARLAWRGILAPGRAEEIRFDVLARAGELLVRLRLDGRDAVLPIVAGGGALRRVASVAHVNLAALEDRDRLPEQAGLALWRSGSSEAALPPALSAEEKQRLRALGYLQ